MISLLFKGDSPDAVCFPAVSGDFEQPCSWFSAMRVQVGKILKAGLAEKANRSDSGQWRHDTAPFLATA
jgi:hypothetical protein